MIPVEDRRAIVANLNDARAAGARLAPACRLIGGDPRTVQRWRRENRLALGDRRPHADRPKPAGELAMVQRLFSQPALHPEYRAMPGFRLGEALHHRGASAGRFEAWNAANVIGLQISAQGINAEAC